MLNQLEVTAITSGRLLDIISFQTEVVQQGVDLAGVIALVAERSQFLTGADGAVVELLEGDEMVYRAVSGIAEPKLGLRLKRDSSLSGYCIKAGYPVFCPDSDNDTRVDREACRMVGLRSMIVVPLKHNEQIVGVLKVMSSRVGIFCNADLHLLELMSDLIAAAMSNAAKYESSEVFHRATHDALTDLPNRALFFDRMHLRLAQACRASERFAMLMLDMDGLKKINDQYGHRAGDAAIREFSRRIEEVSRETDVVARLGGDEFGIILNQATTQKAVDGVIERIMARVQAPFVFEGRRLPLAVSVGAALFPEDGTTINLLMEKSDQAMYQMKSRHKLACAD